MPSAYGPPQPGGPSPADDPGVKVLLAALGVVVLFIVLGVVGGVFWLLSRLGSGLIPPLADFLTWFRGRLPGAGATNAAAVFAAVFAALRLALLPYRLTHARVDRRTGAVKPRLIDVSITGAPRSLWARWQRKLSRRDPAGRFPATRTLVTWVLLAIADCVALIVVMRAAEWGGTAPTAPADARTAARGFLGLLTGAFFLFVPLAGAKAAILLGAWATRSASVGLTRGDHARTPEGFAAGHRGNLTGISVPTVIETVAYTATFMLLFATRIDSGLLWPAFAALMVVDAAFAVLVAALSVALDAAGDRWVRRLAKELAEGADPAARVRAAETLGRLGPWARPVRGVVETASHAADRAVGLAAWNALETMAAVCVVRKTRMYHRPDCTSVGGKKVLRSLHDARAAGYAPCRLCRVRR